MRQSVIFLLSVTLLAACTGSSKVTDTGDGSKTSRRKAECSKLHVDMNSPHLDWYEVDKSVLYKSNEILVLPKSYKVYNIDTAQLNAFFNSIADGQKINTAVPLPSPADCQLFTIKLRQKRGTSLDATGESMGQKIIMAYTNGKLSGLVNWFDIEYEIQTQIIQGMTYVLVYTKMPPPPEEESKPKPQLREYRPVK